MAMQRAKFFQTERDKIQDYINSGDIDAFDVVYTTDTHENIVISHDLAEIPVHSRILRFLDVRTAEKYLNSSKEAYDGQIVAIISSGKYVAYIVNGGSNGKYYVTSLNGYEGTVNYNTLGDKPITNMYGTLDKMVIVDELDAGNYYIQGQYKIDADNETVYMSTNANLFLVDHSDNGARIKKITTSEIVDYYVNNNKDIISSVVPTTEWLKAQGYMSEPEIDQKIAALHFLTIDDISDYVQDIVNSTIETVLDDRIEKKINDIFVPIKSDDIEYMF